MIACSSKIRIIMLVFFTIAFGVSVSAQSKYTDYVNPLIGTDGHGHTYPGASLPFGMVQLSPDTDIEGWDWCSGYHYSDNSIMGFSHTHLSGTGCADYGDILFMPTTGVLKTEPGSKNNPGSGYRSRFSHKNEAAKAGYYSVLLDDYNVKVELTATRRAGFHKYIFPKTDSANVLIDLIHGIGTKTTDSKIKFVNDRTIEGYKRVTGWAKDRFVYFYAEFSKPFKSFGIVESTNIYINKTEATGRELEAFVNYKTSPNEVVYVKVGISSASQEGAKNNLKAEIPGWDFDKTVKLADKEWNKELSAISVETKNKSEKVIFYTALYHALLTPNTFSDIDGNYMGMDKKVHKAKKGHDVYTVYSLWDTFRAENPLFTIIDPGRAQDMVESLILKYKESGVLPVWELAGNETGTMVGYHAIPVIADAYFKGLRDFDVNDAFEAMKKSAMLDKNGLKYYKEMGYIPADLEDESVSKTLEYAYDDWCIAMMAKALGKTEDYNYFIQRAKFYTNVFDPSTLLMRAKKNGKWIEPFDPYAVSGHYTEANAWQYSFFVPQDIDGLIKLMGGNSKFIQMVDKLFTTESKLTGREQSDITGLIGQYAQGDEPSHHMAYLYNYAGAPWKTQEWVHKIVTTLYTDKLDGLCGNDDCGQMSAWYVLSSIGIYPVCPGDNKFVIGTPLFDKVTIKTGKKNFVVTAKNVSDKNIYIQSASLNGKEYNYTYINYADIVKGGSLNFEMGGAPGKWGTDEKFWSKTEVNIPFVSVPCLVTGEKIFEDTTTISLTSVDNKAVIYFSTDGSDPKISRQAYTTPFSINNSTVLKAVCYKDGIFSKESVSHFNKIPSGRTIKLNTKFSDLYSGGGAFGLIDGIKGTDNFHTEAWQGYEGVDLDAVIDLGKVQKISSINTSFLQNTGSWIFYPQSIEYYVSADGVSFTKVYETQNEDTEKNNAPGVKDFGTTSLDVQAKYVKVYAKNVGVCPKWHVAAGNKAWLFVDEISIK